MKIRLGIAIPHTGSIKTRTVTSLVGMFKNLPFEYHFLSHEGSMLHIMRERLVEKAIELKCTHILFVDSDMVFEKDAVLKLLKRKKEIIGANYNKRTLPLESTVEKPKKSKGLTTCDAVATGFMLIDLKVFRHMAKPWFFWGQNGESEDFWFCDLAWKHGYKVWVDFNVKVGHLGEYQY